MAEQPAQFLARRRALMQERVAELRGQREAQRRLLADHASRLQAAQKQLALAPRVAEALEALSQSLFGRIADILASQLTLALQETLEQPIQLKVEREFKRGGSTMKLYVERGGHAEDIMRGQGGSVANILSVVLRLFALTQVDPKLHRKFLVLDEQDCWIRPDLVGRLTRIISEASRELGIQVLLISHHDVDSFAPYVERVHRLAPTANGVVLEERKAPPAVADE